jgi:site-specific DNA recombinase
MALVATRKPPASKERDRRFVVVYGRVSKVDDDRTASLKSQEDGGTKKAIEKHGADPELILKYQEKFTGEELWYRPVMTEIRDMVRQGKVRLLVVYSIDRLARDPVDQAIVIKECKRYDCEVDFVTEDFDDSMEGDLIRFAKGYAAKLEIRLIKDRTTRGKMMLLREGKLLQSGYAAFGYRYTDTHLPAASRTRRAREIDREAADIVVRMFHWIVVDGYGAHTIAKMLNVEGVPAPRAWRGFHSKNGREPIWHASTIRKIVQNPIYCGGDELYGKTQSVGIRPNGRPMQVDRPVEDQIPLNLADPTPAIVSRDLWDQANYRIDNNELGSKKRNGRVPRLLRGMIFCNRCGHPMYPSVAIGAQQKRYHFYICGSPRTRTHDGKRCGAKGVPVEWVESKVWEQVRSMHADRDKLKEGFAQAQAESANPQLKADLKVIEDEIAKQDRLRSVASRKWGEAVAEGDDASAEIFDGHMKLANQKMTAYKDKAATIRARMVSSEQLAQAADEFEALLDAAASMIQRDDVTFDEKRALLEGLRVRVVGDGKWARATFFVHTEGSSRTRRRTRAISRT